MRRSHRTVQPDNKEDRRSCHKRLVPQISFTISAVAEEPRDALRHGQRVANKGGCSAR